MSRYRDATIVVTGAGSGIGRELCLLLARQGARLVLTGRRQQQLHAVRAEITSHGGAALVAPCDLSNGQQVLDWSAAILRATGGVDVLVNNAGRGAYGRFEQVALDGHDAVVDTNLRAIIHTTHAMLPSMLARGKGQLVYVSSVLGDLPAPEHAVYGATKSAVNAFAESLTHELHGRGVAVTVVAPGLVESGFAATAGTPMARFSSLPSKSAVDSARGVLRAMERGQGLCVDDRLSAVAICARRYVPGLFGWVFRKLFERLRRRGHR